MFELFKKTVKGINFEIISDFTEQVEAFIKEIREKIENDKSEDNIATSGYYSQVATSGNDSKVATSGCYSQVATSGDYSQVATSGDNSQVATSGYYSQVATSGHYSQVATSGYNSQVATSGYNSQVEISGRNSIGFLCGIDSIIKAKNGTWICLCEYEKNTEGIYTPIFAKSAQIGNREYKDNRNRILKETEFYTLHNKEFYTVDFSDGIKTMIISEKIKDEITIIKGIDFDEHNEVYIAKEGQLSAHGHTLREAIDDLKFKKMKDINVNDIVKEIRETGKVTRSQYRAITGACSFGTNQFCKKHGIEDLEEIKLEELRKILINDYGAERFWNLIDE